MDLIYVTEARFIRGSDGMVYSDDGVCAYKIWTKFLSTFNHVYVVARVLVQTDYVGQTSSAVEGEGVSVLPLTSYLGPIAFLRNRNRIKNELKQYITKDKAFLFRVPGVLGGLAAEMCRKNRLPYGVEVVADPFDVFAPGSIKHFLRPYLREKLTTDLKRIVKHASCALYVTKNSLQRRYPGSKSTFCTYASDIILPSSAIATAPKILEKKEAYQLISIGSLEQMYKAPDVVLRALQILRIDRYPCKLTWVGEGKYLGPMKVLSYQLGVSESVTFCGRVEAGEKINALLDSSDIFILASKTEGLPRAIIEAMARGLPCIGTEVGGIPELLSQEMIIPKNDPESLAGKIKSLINDRHFANLQAKRNLNESLNYRLDVLTERREEFYRVLNEVSS